MRHICLPDLEDLLAIPDDSRFEEVIAKLPGLLRAARAGIAQHGSVKASPSIQHGAAGLAGEENAPIPGEAARRPPCHRPAPIAPIDGLKVVPHPKLKRDFRGRTVRTTRTITNGYVTIPEGAKATISGQTSRGSTLTFAACSGCGMRPIVSHVAPADIEFVEPLVQVDRPHEKPTSALC